MKKRKFKVGDRVWWQDPDTGVCSQWATIRCMKGDEVLLTNENGSTIGAFLYEISARPPALKTYSVDIQVTEESTYQVKARSATEAEEIAMRLYGDGETPNHESTFDAEITNCEEV